jgi:DNA-binding NarL/FixJ family response regulator
LVLSTRSVLVADADPATRELLSRLFHRVGIRVREASAGHEALADAQREEPGLAIVDVGLPGISGYELCRELKDRFGAEMSVVLVSSERVEPFDRVGGLLLGADDYIVKPFDPDEMLARARRLLERPSAMRPARRSSPNGNPASLTKLTKRELEVLRLLAAGLGQRAIARELVITPKTVSTHIQRILAKLGVHNQAQAVAAAFRLGLAQDAELV